HQIRPAEIQGLYLCSFDWAKLVQILPKETTLSRYVVDASIDHPPIFNSHQGEHFQPSFYISTQNRMEHLTHTQSKNAQYLSRNKKMNQTPALHIHIYNLLSNNIKRREKSDE